VGKNPGGSRVSGHGSLGSSRSATRARLGTDTEDMASRAWRAREEYVAAIARCGARVWGAERSGRSGKGRASGCAPLSRREGGAARGEVGDASGAEVQARGWRSLGDKAARNKKGERGRHV
jgi:hypothetical protein